MPSTPAAASECADCHPEQVASFGHSAMASAATGAAFLAEQAAASRPRRCLRCHAPGGGPGVTCADCHGDGPHPYPQVRQPAACGRCHDAAGENTLRSYRSSPAAAAGRRCSDCHALTEGRFSHDFRGPTRNGFLEGVATLRAFLRTDPEAPVVVVRIHHRAGHALPGGTTGRAVWLRLQGLDRAGNRLWEEVRRFGWEHRTDGRWLDRTLPPGVPVLLELPVVTGSALHTLRLQLIYRFRPGPLDAEDSAAVILDGMDIEWPR